jgi:hypothetical protein
MNIGFCANLMCVPEAFCFDLEPHCYNHVQAWAQDQAHRRPSAKAPRGRSLAARWSLASLGTVR